MELTDRYIYAVTRQLPEDQRDDVSRELRATIEDTMVEGNDDEAAVLMQLGDPAILARQYGAKPGYLIGPDFYPSYIAALRVITPIVVALLTILTVAEGWSDQRDTGEILIDVLKAGLFGAAQVVFWATLGFAIAERSGSQPPNRSDSWSLDDLPEAKPARQISKVDALAGAALSLFVPLLVVVAPRQLDRLEPDGIPLFDPGLSDWWLYGFIAIFVLFFFHQIWQYQVGKWTTPLMVSLIVLNAIWLVYLFLLFTGEELINPAWLESVAPESTGQGKQWILGTILATAAVVSVIEVVEAIQGNRRLKPDER